MAHFLAVAHRRPIIPLHDSFCIRGILAGMLEGRAESDRRSVQENWSLVSISHFAVVVNLGNVLNTGYVFFGGGGRPFHVPILRTTGTSRG